MRGATGVSNRDTECSPLVRICAWMSPSPMSSKVCTSRNGLPSRNLTAWRVSQGASSRIAQRTSCDQSLAYLGQAAEDFRRVAHGRPQRSRGRRRLFLPRLLLSLPLASCLTRIADDELRE